MTSTRDALVSQPVRPPAARLEQASSHSSISETSSVLVLQTFCDIFLLGTLGGEGGYTHRPDLMSDKHHWAFDIVVLFVNELDAMIHQKLY